MLPEVGTYVKSSISGNGGCVEVARSENGASLRDTKDRSKPANEIPAEDWRMFVDAADLGFYDLPEDDS